MSSLPSETSSLLGKDVQRNDTSINNTGSLTNVSLKSASPGLPLGDEFDLPAPPSANTIRRKANPTSRPPIPTREQTKFDLLQSLQTRALTESIGSLYEELISRPTIHEYEDTVRKVYGIPDDELTEFSNERGQTFMTDLKTKRQGIVPFEQIITFGHKVKPQMLRYIHKKSQKKSQNYGHPDIYKTHGQSGYSSTTESHTETEDSEIMELPFIYWIDILNPSNSQVEDLQEAYSVHPLTSEDILIRGTREKLEEYSSYMYLVFNERQRVPNSNQYRDVNLNLLIFPGVILSIHMLPVKSLTQVMYHVQHSTLPNNVPVDWVAYKFLDMITDEFVLMVDAIYREVDYLDTMVHDIGEGNKEEILRRIGVARQRLTKLRGSLLSKREIVATLSSQIRTSIFVSENTKIYFRDVMDHIVLMIQRLEMANEMLNNTSSLYLAMISIEIAATDQKMNEAMKCFGAVATIMLPLTVMTGLWGMNVQVPGQAGIASPGDLWFLLIILSFVIWIVIAGVIFRYKRWL